jgi:hypothetical protein
MATFLRKKVAPEPLQLVGARPRRTPKGVPAEEISFAGAASWHPKVYPKTPNGKFAGAKRDWAFKPSAPGRCITVVQPELRSEDIGLTHAQRKAEERQRSVR